MIARYSRSEMAEIWSDRFRYRVWLEVELAVCHQLAAEGRIPRKDWTQLKSALDKLLKAGGVDPKRVDEHEKVTRHDVIAFTTAVAEKIGPISRYVHYGLTSSDVVDTSLSLLIQRSGRLLLADLDRMLKVLKDQARKYQYTPCIGRSHGIFAEPTSFGLKFLGWYCEMKRNRERLVRALEECRTGKLSGAVGVNAHWGPAFEEKVLERLGLMREPVSTQVVPRDRHVQFLHALASCGDGIERMAVELRHLQRSEVGEVLEGFSKGQKGSSAMPHKRNPISSENLTGIARLLRSYVQAGHENVALWHERDISHSSAERIILPDATGLLDYALDRMTRVLENLDVREKAIRANLEKAGATVFSGHFLLALVEKGVTREDAYAWVQGCALGSFEGQGDFLKLMQAHPEVSKHLRPKDIAKLGSMKYQLRNVKAIYAGAFKA